MLTAQALNLGISPLIFNAEMAYQIRPFAAAKRHRSENVTLTSSDVHASDRQEIEHFIHEVFAKTYGADVQHFLPTLIGLRDTDGQLIAAFGLRKASEAQLFLERYLDAPVETVFSRRFNRNITRNQITEFGNLAVANPRNAGVLIAHVIQHGLDIGLEWGVATAHHTLQNGLIKGGRDVFALQGADKHRLSPEELDAWGSYYDNGPQVVAIRGIAKL